MTASSRLRPGLIAVRTRRWSLRLNGRVLALSAVALAVIAAIATWSMSLGEIQLPWDVVARAVVGIGHPGDVFIVQQLRLPRIVAALLVGAALALSGMIFQGLVRNELASPDIIGINAGAAAAGFVWLLLVGDTSALPVALFLGALGTAAVIYGLSWRGGMAPDRMILVGIGVASLLTAAETFLVRRFPIENVIWVDNLLLGTVGVADWSDNILLLTGLGVLVPLALVLSWPLRTMQLGDDAARSVGWSVEVIRLLLIVVASWLSALAISVAGLIGFIALLVPHAARMIAGPISASVMVFTALLGAGVLLAGDIVAFHLLPVGLPVSVVMGAIGAPYFLFLFWRSEVRL
ncbi:iron ABC transporter permease [Microbacterium sp. NPDC089189]|uniref:FecCD family ABC transporter permease n=1 Tax=Microbacterium sp. NPDC089189 TaxID=3154972 RepID=UPI003422E43B